jgi:hypothetical protein
MLRTWLANLYMRLGMGGGNPCFQETRPSLLSSLRRGLGREVVSGI